MHACIHAHTHITCCTRHTFLPTYLYTLLTQTHMYICVVHTLPLQPTCSAPTYLSSVPLTIASPVEASLLSMEQSQPPPLPLLCPMFTPLKLLTRHHSYLVCPLLNSELPRSLNMCIHVCPWDPTQ